MSENPAQATKILESTVDGFMASSNYWLGSFSSWQLNVTRLSLVSIICFSLLSIVQFFFQVVSKDSDIRPFATGKRTIDPHNCTSLDADCNFITKTRSIILMRVPTFPEGLLLMYTEVGSVARHLAFVSNIPLEPVLPQNLKQQAEEESVTMANHNNSLRAIPNCCDCYLPAGVPNRKSPPQKPTTTF